MNSLGFHSMLHYSHIHFDTNELDYIEKKLLGLITG